MCIRDRVFEICDRYTILRNGENVLTGSTEKLDNRSCAYYRTGRRFLDVKFTAPKKGKEALLEVKHLTAVSYTHLDVYKRQGYADPGSMAESPG